MSRFWDLFAESVIVQALLTLIVVCSVVYMHIQGQEVSKEMWGLMSLIVGFYFGGKAPAAAARARRLE